MLSRFFKRIAVILLAVMASASAVHAASGGPDSFGYTWKDSNAASGPTYQWIDITQAGTRILSGPARPEPQTVATLQLNPPPMFYASPRETVRVSRHGYISMNASDPGTDSTNLCPFTGQNPAIGARPRYLVHHDENTATTGFGVWHRFFDTSPHNHHPGPVHVITWQGVRLASDPSNTNVSFQALLFLNGDILYQYKDMPPGGSTSASAGLLDFLTPGISYACNNAAAFPSNHAVLFEPPTVVFNAGGNLQDLINTTTPGTKIVFDPADIGPLPGELFGNTILAGGAELDRNLIIDGLRFDVPDGIRSGVLRVRSGVYGVIMGMRAGQSAFVFQTGTLTVEPNGHGIFAGNYAQNDVANGHLIRVLENGRAYVSRLSHPHNEFNIRTGNDGPLLRAANGAEIILADSTIQHIESSASPDGIIRADSGDQFSLTLRGCTIHDIRNTNGSSGSIETSLLNQPIGLVDLRIESCRITTAIDAGRFLSGQINTVIDRSSLERVPIQLAAFLPSIPPPTLLVRNSTLIETPVGAPNPVLEFSYFRRNTITPEVGGSASHCVFDLAGVNAGGTAFSSLGYNAFFPLTLNGPVFTAPTDISTTVFATQRDDTGATVVFRPTASSPLVDAGDPALAPVPSTDQTGGPRLVDGDGNGVARIDIGPVEIGISDGPIIVTTTEDDPLFGTTLRQAVATASTSLNPRRILFDPALSGATFTLLESNGPLIINVGKQIEIDASALPQRPSLRGLSASGLGFIPEMPLIDVSRSLFIRNFRFSEVRRCINAQAGSLHLVDCVFSDNGSPNQNTPAAAIIASGSGPGGGAALILEQCVFSRNRTNGFAGAIHMDSFGGSLTVRNCRFNDNAGGNLQGIPQGSAIRIVQFLDSIEITDSTFSGNTGYAITLGNQNGATTVPPERRRILNCTFAHNERAIEAANSDFVMRHCTIARHSPTPLFPALRIMNSTVQLSHCIIANNWDAVTGRPLNATGSTGNFVSEGYNIDDGNELGLDGPGDLIHNDPLLAPFAHYGGSGRSFALLAESPAIDGGNPDLDNLPAGDIRDYLRAIDGNGDGQAAPDIGSFEAGPAILVGQLAPKSDNQPPYSLPEAVALASPGGRVLFDRSLSGGSINLTTPLAPAVDLMIDASNLLVGPRIGGGDTTRLLEIAAGLSVSCHALVLRRGFHPGDGGAIHNSGNLCLHACNVARSEAGGMGGGIYQDGGNLVLESTTLAENTAATGGGAIADNPARRSNLVLRHTTLCDNHSTTGSGGLRLGNSSAAFAFTLTAANTNTTGTRNLATQPATTLTSLGFNLCDNADFGFTQRGDLVSTNTGLSPVADNGGWVPTAAVATTSAASQIVGSLGPTAGFSVPSIPPFDGRGFARRQAFISGSLYYGAHQPGGDTHDFDADGMPDWWERRYGFNLANFADAAENADGDDFSNLVEFQNGTHPRIFDGDPAPPADLRILAVARNGNPGSLDLTFTSEPGRSYTIQYSLNLDAPWTDLTTHLAAAAETTVTANLPAPLQGEPRAFFRVKLLP